MSEWRSQGKQVLQDGRHFADAAGELEAMMIVNAMKGMDALAANAPSYRVRYEQSTYEPRIEPVEQRHDQPTIRGFGRAGLCRPRREGDEYVCSKGCGVRWDVRESAPRCGRAGNG